MTANGQTITHQMNATGSAFPPADAVAPFMPRGRGGAVMYSSGHDEQRQDEQRQDDRRDDEQRQDDSFNPLASRMIFSQRPPVLSQTPSFLDASFLADAVARATDRRERAAAWEQLWEQSGRAIAQRVKGQFARSAPDDFVEHAAGVIYEKLARGMYDWRAGTFGSWCFTVLHRHAISLYHQARRSATSLETLALEPASRATSQAEPFGETPALQALLGRLRSQLDELSARPELVSQVNYYAVLLVELRRGLVMRLRGRGILPGLSALLPRWNALADSAIVAQLLPWRSAEMALRIRPVYPALGPLWTALAAAVDAPPHDLNVDVLRQHILCPGGAALTGDAWFNWKRHLRRRLSSLVEQSVWDGVFAPWF
jgi:DNA-directed RNA polymerase specialized sigma24 family protein